MRHAEKPVFDGLTRSGVKNAASARLDPKAAGLKGWSDPRLAFRGVGRSARMTVCHFANCRRTTLDLLDSSGNILKTYKGTRAMDVAGKLLPLAEWLRAINRAETVGPILDPTLYREYLNSPKSVAIKELIEAAIPLKAVVDKWRGKIAADEEAFK